MSKLSITSLYRQITSLPNFRPSQKVNSLFSNLVENVLSDRKEDLSNIDVNNLQNICSQAEYELEKYWSGQDVQKFPYYQNYLDLTKLEWSALQSCTNHSRHSSVVFIGSGPLPLTAIILARDYGCNVTLIDINAEAIELSRKLINNLGLTNKFSFHCGNAANFKKFKEFEVIYLAALAGVTPHQKGQIFKSISIHAQNQAHIIARSSWGKRKLLYRPISKQVLESFSPIIEVRPYNHVVNSFFILKNHRIANLKIIQPGLDQLSAVKDFLYFIVKDDFGYHPNPEWHWDIESLQETYLNNPRTCLFIATVNGEIVGVIAGRPYDRNYKNLSYDPNKTLGIWRNYVRKDYRQYKIGSKLFGKLENFAREQGYKNLYLHTQKTVPAALKYWKSLGFRVTIKAEDSFGTIHMEKNLDE